MSTYKTSVEVGNKQINLNMWKQMLHFCANLNVFRGLQQQAVCECSRLDRKNCLDLGSLPANTCNIYENVFEGRNGVYWFLSCENLPLLK